MQWLVPWKPSSIKTRKKNSKSMGYFSVSIFVLLSTLMVARVSSGPVSSADLSPVEMMRKFQGWVFASSSTSSSTSSSSNQVPPATSSTANNKTSIKANVEDKGKRGAHGPTWSHSRGSGEQEEFQQYSDTGDFPVTSLYSDEDQIAQVTHDEQRLTNVQNNPGAWGISDVQDQEFLKVYLKEAKQNFGDKLADPPRIELSEKSRIELSERLAAEQFPVLAGFIRAPHLPSSWYTAETHEPVKKQLFDEEDYSQDDTLDDDSATHLAPFTTEVEEPVEISTEISDRPEEIRPFVFYSDWTKPNHTIEAHLKGSLEDHVIDIEEENEDLPYQEPNIGCLAKGSNFCSIEQDFPKAIMGWIDEKFAEILSNFSLPNTPEAEAGGPLFAVSRDYITPDDAPCESQRSDLQPSWVRDEKTGAWVLVVQTMTLQQWVRLEECTSKGISCQYVMPYYGSVCREKSTLHQVVAWNPSAPEMLSFAYFKAPNGCECHITHSSK